MSRKTLMTLATLCLASSVLAGCGTVPMAGMSPAGETSAKSQAANAQRPLPPAVVLAADALTEGDAIVDASYEVDRARRIASDTLYRYDVLLRDWKRAYSDYEKDRIESRMLDELIAGLKDVQRAVSSGSGRSAREVYDVADRALDRYDSLRRDWSRAYTDRERRYIVNDMLVALTGAHKDIKAIY